jgi:hypothetical protein
MKVLRVSMIIATFFTVFYAASVGAVISGVSRDVETPSRSSTVKASLEIVVPMSVDVDGAPTTYGPDDSKALDYELNAHVGAKKTGAVVGYLLDKDGKPLIQGKNDPAPGFYISTTGYFDHRNPNKNDPRRYVDASEINYTILARAASNAGVMLGDFCVVYSKKTDKTVYAIVGDSGHSSGAEGSLALLQRLGYSVKNGKAGGVDTDEIVVRYFRRTNPSNLFFTSQTDLDAAAAKLDLDKDFDE